MITKIHLQAESKIYSLLNSFHARVYIRKIENNRFLLSLITSDDRNYEDRFHFWSL